MSRSEKPEFDVQAFWNEWFDYSCRCGFPHPKPGRHGPPPEIIERDGITYRLPRYPGILGGDEPVPRLP